MATPAPRQQSARIAAPASMLAIQIVQAAVRPNVTVNELVTLSQADPAFVIRLLSYVNSSGFGLQRKVTAAQQAVSLLGIRGTRNLALSTCVSEMTPRGEDGEVLLAACLRRGIAAKLAAQKLGKPSPDDYFTLGVLLETGFLIKAKDDLKGAAEFVRSPSATRVMMERSSGQEDHAKLGARLAKTWHLDDETALAIARHHEKEPPGFDLGAIGWLAERLAGVFEGGDVSSNRVAAVEAGAKLKLSGAAIDEILQAIPATILETASQFQRTVGPQADLDTLLRDANSSLIEINRSYAEIVHRLESLLQEKERLAADLKVANEALTTLALTDGLTGLTNHRAFQEALARDVALADRQKTPISVIVLDADHFKKVNDTYGHQTGDVVLKAIAEILKASVRVSDIAARVGGEEFSLLLPGTDAEGAKIVAERVRKCVAERIIQGPFGEFRVTVSLGIAMTRGPGCRGREAALYEAADKALYLAKQSGRNRVQVGSL